MPNGKEYPVNFCDTAGQERYRSMSLSVIKKTDAGHAALTLFLAARSLKPDSLVDPRRPENAHDL